MKKVVIFIIGSVSLILVYQLIFSYRLVALSNSGDLKHKINDVHYFPSPPLSILNPIKKKGLKNQIVRYSEKVLANTSKKDTNLMEEYHKSYLKTVRENDFTLLSIKRVNNKLHVLTRLIKSDATLVFEIEEGKINGYY